MKTRQEYNHKYYTEHSGKNRKIIKYADELYDELAKRNKGNYTRMCLTQHLHPYECDIETCNKLDEHIWYDLQVVKSLMLNK